MITERIQEKCPGALLGAHRFREDETVVVNAPSLLTVAHLLKEDPDLDFDVLMDLSAVDYQSFGDPGPSRSYVAQGTGPRFEVVYHFYSLKKNHRLRLKVPVEEKDAKVPSVAGIWAAANWYEREIWDMFGIRFDGHPNLKRIMMYEEFTGHPLRKDYPVNKRQPLIGPKN